VMRPAIPNTAAIRTRLTNRNFSKPDICWRIAQAQPGLPCGLAVPDRWDAVPRMVPRSSPRMRAKGRHLRAGLTLPELCASSSGA
jgi:hypothetical protein